MWRASFAGEALPPNAAVSCIERVLWTRFAVRAPLHVLKRPREALSARVVAPGRLCCPLCTCLTCVGLQAPRVARCAHARSPPLLQRNTPNPVVARVARNAGLIAGPRLECPHGALAANTIVARPRVEVPGFAFAGGCGACAVAVDARRQRKVVAQGREVGAVGLACRAPIPPIPRVAPARGGVDQGPTARCGGVLAGIVCQ
mmetsp:Transcript_21741/g.50462  ORF Transcript_21741/g.50462 Transcript_21741/m.50462 type:complete len:202 (+) Transcript_21741:2876-3481(+)